MANKQEEKQVVITEEFAADVAHYVADYFTINLGSGSSSSKSAWNKRVAKYEKIKEAVKKHMEGFKIEL